jgi:trehalose synthase
VNALQRRAAVVLQKFIREGFGLAVTEAMWKGAPVIGGNVGGIRRQIRDGENGPIYRNRPVRPKAVKSGNQA